MNIFPGVGSFSSFQGLVGTHSPGHRGFSDPTGQNSYLSLHGYMSHQAAYVIQNRSRCAAVEKPIPTPKRFAEFSMRFQEIHLLTNVLCCLSITKSKPLRYNLRFHAGPKSNYRIDVVALFNRHAFLGITVRKENATLL